MDAAVAAAVGVRFWMMSMSRKRKRAGKWKEGTIRTGEKTEDRWLKVGSPSKMPGKS